MANTLPSHGRRPHNLVRELAAALRADGFEVHVIGDAAGIGYIRGAMHAARAAIVNNGRL